MLLGIILFPLSMGFGLICGPWAFPTTPVLIHWDKRTGLSFWVSARDLGVSLGWPLSWPSEWAYEPYFSNPITNHAIL